MNQFKRAKVIILFLSRNNGCLTQNRHNLKLNIGGSPSTSDNRHLYIISDDEIKEGDWFIHHSHEITTLLKAINVEDRIFDNQGTSCCKSYCRKIIATTDNSLKITKKTNNPALQRYISQGTVSSTYEESLPQPSQQFIEKYIESYNKGEVITDILVEYEGKALYTEQQHFKGYKDILKINPKDNTITIKKIKDSWNRNEVITILNKLNNTLNIGSDLTLEEWIERNL